MLFAKPADQPVSGAEARGERCRKPVGGERGPQIYEAVSYPKKTVVNVDMVEVLFVLATVR